MRIGKLCNRVRIERRQTGTDAVGGVLTDWDEVKTVWGDVRQESGFAAIKSEVETSEVRASIRIRFLVGISPGMRAVVDGVIYRIDAVRIDQKTHAYMDLVCRRTEHAGWETAEGEADGSLDPG